MHNPRKIISLFSVGLILVLARPGIVAGEEDVKSNLQILSDMSTEIVMELLQGFQGKEGVSRGIVLVPHASDERYEFLTNIFIAALASGNIMTYLPGDEKPAGKSNSDFPTGRKGALKLEFQALEFNLAYTKVFRSYLFGGKKVKRRADVKIFAKLLDPQDQSVVWVGEASRIKRDQFPFYIRPVVEEGLFAFTKPPFQPPHWSRIVEPVVVSGIIVGLVYLFYSNQSD